MPIQPNVTYAGDGSALFALASSSGSAWSTFPATSNVTLGAFDVTGIAGSVVTANTVGTIADVNADAVKLTPGAVEFTRAGNSEIIIQTNAVTGDILEILGNGPIPIVSIDGTGGDIDITTNVRIISAGTLISAPMFSFENGPNLGNYGSTATITAGNSLTVSNANVTADSIILSSAISAAALTVPIRTTINPGVSFTFYNDNAVSISVMYAVLSYDAGN